MDAKETKAAQGARVEAGELESEEQIALIEFDATILVLEESEGPDHDRCYMVKIWFATQGPRYFGPFPDEVHAQKFQEKAQRFLVRCEEQCIAGLLNGDFSAIATLD